MRYQGLRFFNGMNTEIELSFDSALGAYTGTLNLNEVSTGLYEAATIFILEEVVTQYGAASLMTPIGSNVGSQFMFKFADTEYTSKDINVEVTDAVDAWNDGVIGNNGFIVRHSIDVENNDLDYGVLKFFSKETNTIYEPKLELVWDDSLFITGSLTPVTGSASDDYKVVVTNLKNQYSKNTKVKIRVKGRDMFPYKTFGTTFGYDQAKYLPSGSTYYQIEDYITNEIIVPFGDYSKLSCDSTSNYFNLDTSTYAADRVYRLKIKILQNGITDIIDDKLTFKIVE